MVLSINTKFSQGFWAIQKDAFYTLFGFISKQTQGKSIILGPKFHKWSKTRPYKLTGKFTTGQDQDQDSLLVKRRNDNHSPGPVIKELVPSSHQRSELSNTILCIFSGWDQWNPMVTSMVGDKMFNLEVSRITGGGGVTIWWIHFSYRSLCLLISYFILLLHLLCPCIQIPYVQCVVGWWFIQWQWGFLYFEYH